jgi:PAS domain S-box-containing protein
MMLDPIEHSGGTRVLTGSSEAHPFDGAPPGRPAAEEATLRRELLHAKEALRHLTQHQHLLFETMHQGVVFQDAAGKVILMNPAAERILGRTPADFYGRSSEEEEVYTVRENGSPFPGKEHPSMVALRTGQELRDVVMGVYNLRERSYRWISISAVPIFRRGEDRPYQVYALFDDITERRQMEAALRRSEATLAEAGCMAHLGAWEVEFVIRDDVWANPLRWSDEVYRIFGYEPGSVAVTHELFVARVHPKDRRRVATRVAQAIAQHKPYSLEHRIVRPDGTERIVFEHAQIVFDERGQPLRIVGAVQDITERKEVEEQLQQLSEQLEQRVAERTAQLRALAEQLTRAEERERRRVAQVLHDGLQQLLAGAKFTLQSISRTSEDPAVQQELLRVEDILGESLQVSRSLAHELSPPILHQQDLGAILKWLAHWYEEKHGLTVTLEVAQPVTVEAEEIRITLFRAVMELLLNVVKHARTKTAQLSLGPTREGAVRVVVSDQGPGFNPTEIGVWEGTDKGFGLFHVRQRLELHGGRLEVDSGHGRGSHFTLDVPLTARPPLQSRASPRFVSRGPDRGTPTARRSRRAAPPGTGGRRT